MNKSSTRMSAVKAMVWKEWRERFLWAMVASLALVFVLSLVAYSIHKDATSMGERDYRNFGDSWDFAQSCVAVGTPLFALCLGFAQMNDKGDSWAFLIHRPASRRFLFWSKVLSGLSLCAFVAFFSYGFFTLWAALENNIPVPFSWRMLLFGWVVVTLCIPPYFAGALMALRVRSWVGSRALPVLGVLFCLIVALSYEVWARNLLYAACTLAVALAAQGAFECESAQRRNRWSQVALSSTLLAGLGAVLLFVICLVALAQIGVNKNSFSGAQSQYVVTQSGQVALRRTQFNSDPNVVEKTTMSDLKGRVLVQKSKTLEFSVLFSPQSPNAAPLPIHYANTFVFLGTWRDGVLPNAPTVSWWFDCVARRIVGYLAHPKRVYGYIGVNGFVKSARECQSFEETPLNSSYEFLNFPHSVYAFNWLSKRVKKIYQSNEEIIDANFGGVMDNGDLTWSDARITTRQNLVFLQPHGKSRSVALPDAKQFDILLAQSSNGHTWLQFSPKRNGDEPTTFVELSSNGEVLQKQVVSSLPASDAESLLNSVDSISARASVALLPAVVTRWSVDEVRRSLALDSQPPSRGSARDGILLSVVLSALCALLAWYRASRYAFKSSTRIAWTIGVFMLGPLGFLLMRSLFDWPSLEKCPSCAKLRVVDRALCEHCNSPFAPPMPDGTEIVELSETARLPALQLAS